MEERGHQSDEREEPQDGDASVGPAFLRGDFQAHSIDTPLDWELLSTPQPFL
jgi:hypothetical protein